jgi:ribosomal protein S6--L-glutamate ligase
MPGADPPDSTHGHTIGQPSRAITIARNKFLTQQTLTAAGLHCPDTVFINDASGFYHATDGLGGYPVVVKQVSERQGNGVLRINDPEDALQRALPALDRNRGLMVQRYLPPEKRRDIRALVIGGELICAAALVPPPGDFRANFHLGGRHPDNDPFRRTRTDRGICCSSGGMRCGRRGHDGGR